MGITEGTTASTATTDAMAEAVRAVLAGVIDPNTGKDFVSSKSLKSVRQDGDGLALDIELGYPANSQLEPVRRSVEAALRQAPALAGLGALRVNVRANIVQHVVQRGVKLLPNVKNIIAVASGKGGVGKSTTAVNLALAMAAEGASVGILDADIYGPSLPMMMGIEGRPEVTERKTMLPMENHGLQVASIGFMVDPNQSVAWRGPMVTGALQQLLELTEWRALDYLFVDMPPGTGDIQLTLAQKVPVTGAVIVTTPQDIALLDARKGMTLFGKVDIPVLGVVENMGIHICSNCGHAEHIFGSGGGERLCAEFGVDFLGGLPLDLAIREQADSGCPTVVADPDGKIAAIYKAIARKVAVKVAEKAKDMSAKFPSIVVRND